MAGIVGLPGRASAAVLHVPGDYPTIQLAVDGGVSGDEIRVAEGTYAESVLWVGKALHIVGAGAGASILDPGSAGRCVTMIDVRDGGILEGFTCQHGRVEDADGGGMLVQGGSAAVYRATFTSNGPVRNGGALWNDGADVLVVDSTFLDNEGSTGGGALGVTGAGRMTVMRSTFTGNFSYNGGALLSDERSALVVLDSRFETNFGRSGGAILTRGGVLEIARSVVRDNDSDFVGSAVFAAGSVRITDSTFELNESQRNRPAIVVKGDLTMTGSSVARNIGGGLSVEGDATVQGCAFWNNSAERGGAIAAVSGHVSVVDSVFYRNTANGFAGLGVVSALGGAVYNAGSSLRVTRSIFHRNRALSPTRPEDGGAVYADGGTTTLVSSILWGDSPNEISGDAPVTSMNVTLGPP